MDKKRIEIIITGALILIFIFAWGNAFKIIKKKAGQVRNADISNLRRQKAVSFLDKPPIVISVGDKPARAGNTEAGPVWGRCPFSGEAYFCDEEAIGLRLTGIMGDKKDSLAIINGDIVKIGDKIGAVIVVDIKQDRVILNDGFRNIELVLKE